MIIHMYLVSAHISQFIWPSRVNFWGTGCPLSENCSALALCKKLCDVNVPVAKYSIAGSYWCLFDEDFIVKIDGLSLNIHKQNIASQNFSNLNSSIVTWFWKTHQIVTNEISRNTNFKYWSHHGSLMLDYSHASFTV